MGNPKNLQTLGLQHCHENCQHLEELQEPPETRAKTLPRKLSTPQRTPTTLRLPRAATFPRKLSTPTQRIPRPPQQSCPRHLRNNWTALPGRPNYPAKALALFFPCFVLTCGHGYPLRGVVFLSLQGLDLFTHLVRLHCHGSHGFPVLSVLHCFHRIQFIDTGGQPLSSHCLGEGITSGASPTMGGNYSTSPVLAS